MEVCDKSVYNLEFVTRIDENTGIICHFLQCAVFFCNAFENSAGGSADCDNSAAVLSAAVDFFRTFTAYRKIFTVHNVVIYVVLFYGAEGAKTNVKHNGNYCGAVCLDFFEQFFGKVKSCGGGGSTAFGLCINSLITAVVREFFGDIRGKGHIAYLFKYRVDFGAAERKLDKAVAFFNDVYYLACENSVAKDEFFADFSLFTRANKRFPHSVAVATEKQKFNHTVILFGICSENACRYNFRIVYDKHVFGADIVGYVEKTLVLKLAAFTVNNKQSGVITLLCRGLRYLGFGQIIIKIAAFKLGFDAFVYYHISFAFKKITYFINSTIIVRIHCNFKWRAVMDINNSKKTPFIGVASALATPFRSGEIDKEAFAGICEWQCEMGVDALCVAGTTGEAATLTRSERRVLLSVAKEKCKSGVKIIAGCGSANTETACNFCRDAALLGVDALLVITPYCNKGTESGITEHFRRVADAAGDIPVILYNVPSRTGVDLSFSQYIELAKVENICAVKEATQNLTKMTRLAGETDLTVYSGNDDMVLPVISVGGKGVISVLSNIAPAAVSTMVHAALNGNFATASKLAHRYAHLIELLFAETNPAPVKYAMKLLDLSNGEMRLPMAEISDKTKALIKAEMQSLSMI